MVKSRKKVTLITNIILTVAFSVVFAVSFYPKAMPIYGGKSLSAIYNGNKQDVNVSLMFNVYENAEVVEKIVDLLDEKGVKATFFVGGCWADDNEKTLKKIVNSGHEIANHGYFHKDHAKLGYEDNKQEIYLTGVMVKALCGEEPKLFAPPSGSYCDKTLQAAEDLDYKVIMWTKDTIDWRDSDLDTLYKRAIKNPSGGDLILMHPKVHTLKVLPKVIDFYTDGGYKLVTVSENIFY